MNGGRRLLRHPLPFSPIHGAVEARWITPKTDQRRLFFGGCVGDRWDPCPVVLMLSLPCTS